MTYRLGGYPSTEVIIGGVGQGLFGFLAMAGPGDVAEVSLPLVVIVHLPARQEPTSELVFFFDLH